MTQNFFYQSSIVCDSIVLNIKLLLNTGIDLEYKKKKIHKLSPTNLQYSKHKGTPDEIKFWCEKYNLNYKEYSCEKCGGIYKMDVMYAKNNIYFGLESSPCESCGHYKIKKTYISFNEKANNVVRRLMGFAK